MSDAQSLLEKYKNEDASKGSDIRQNILEMSKPNWGKFEATSQYERILSELDASAESAENQAAFTRSIDTVKACMAAMAIKDDAAPVQYILTICFDMMREDGSVYNIFDQALKNDVNVVNPIMGILQRSSADPNWGYVADKGAWLLSSVISHSPKYFGDETVKNFLSALLSGSSCSEQGVLEAITNLLKSEPFRALVWSHSGVASLVFNADPKIAPSPIMYKSVFAIWMVSFDPSLDLRKNEVVTKIKAVLAFSRTEKVIRLCLTLLKNFLAQKKECKAICEDIAEEGVLEAVQQLEYEKWRDAELYDDIRELVQLIASEVKELSNFDRYMKELETGTLSWGFIHSSKFFGENVMKFENQEFKALKLLASLLGSSNATTLAVACHDIGEFVSLHPLGKKQVGRLGVKERVMELMGSQDPEMREVRREALLCCQKIMLNKWQEVAADKK